MTWAAPCPLADSEDGNDGFQSEPTDPDRAAQRRWCGEPAALPRADAGAALMPTRVLLIDTNGDDRQRLQQLIRATDPDVQILQADTAETALSAHAEGLDVIFLDDQVPQGDVTRAIDALLGKHPKCAIILTMDAGREDLAKSAIMQGAVDYIAKANLTEGAVRRIIKVGRETALMRWKIEQQRRDLTTFANVLVHDFRAPIVQVSCMAELLSESLREGDTEAAQQELAMLQKSARQMAELVDSLSALIQTDRQPRIEKVTADDLSDRAMTALRRTIVQADAHVEVTPGPYDIACSPPQIAQLIQNLVANAIKFAIGVRPHVRLNVAPDGADHLLFSVSDNGIGVPDSFREAMFEPFRRLHPTDTIPGSGLGLATCKRIVEHHGGTIWCSAPDSNAPDGPNPGTTIWFRLPRNLGTEEQCKPGRTLIADR
ncbi:HAMP domain-containing histidine kinase [Puniceibacterium sp. HSS470]|nr:HAMP domain-containing sensor histidine kinase [Pseudooceanicola sediminis]KAA2314565.1 HAMP domain-containing histidine kinase [Puniceibacterium sp. HSS470]|tara:strand:+ start:35 stop:1324 length:1290 start_codon:yes stop_codon:yes gene_type:complete